MSDGCGVLVGNGVADGDAVTVAVTVGVDPEIVKKIAVGGPQFPASSRDSTKSVCRPAVNPSVESWNVPLYTGT